MIAELVVVLVATAAANLRIAQVRYDSRHATYTPRHAAGAR